MLHQCWVLFSWFTSAGGIKTLSRAGSDYNSQETLNHLFPWKQMCGKLHLVSGGTFHCLRDKRLKSVLHGGGTLSRLWASSHIWTDSDPKAHKHDTGNRDPGISWGLLPKPWNSSSSMCLASCATLTERIMQTLRKWLNQNVIRSSERWHNTDFIQV